MSATMGLHDEGDGYVARQRVVTETSRGPYIELVIESGANSSSFYIHSEDQARAIAAEILKGADALEATRKAVPVVG